MPASSTSSPSSKEEDEKHTSADEDVTPTASPSLVKSEVVKEEENDDADRTLTMPSTSQDIQVCIF